MMRVFPSPSRSNLMLVALSLALGLAGCVERDTDPPPAERALEGCVQGCVVLSACFEDAEADAAELECDQLCAETVEEFENVGDACVTAFADYVDCVGALSCEQLNSEDPPAQCDETIEAFDAHCEDVSVNDCSAWGGGSPDGNSCEAGSDCDGLSRRVSCDADGCTCYENDAITASCPSANACTDGGAEDAFVTCCGWDR